MGCVDRVRVGSWYSACCFGTLHQNVDRVKSNAALEIIVTCFDLISTQARQGTLCSIAVTLTVDLQKVGKSLSQYSNTAVVCFQVEATEYQCFILRRMERLPANNKHFTISYTSHASYIFYYKLHYSLGFLHSIHQTFTQQTDKIFNRAALTVTMYIFSWTQDKSYLTAFASVWQRYSRSCT